MFTTCCVLAPVLGGGGAEIIPNPALHELSFQIGTQLEVWKDREGTDFHRWEYPGCMQDWGVAGEREMEGEGRAILVKWV